MIRRKIRQRSEDGYVNATALSKAHQAATNERRDVGHWLETQAAQRAIQHLSLKTGIPVIKLVEAKKGRHGGTYIHLRLSVRFAMWLNDEFGYLVEEWVEQWMTTGRNSSTTELALPKDPILAQLESLIEVRQKQLDQERMLQEQQQRIDRQQEQIQEFKNIQVAAQLELKALPSSSHAIPPERLDMKVRRIVNDYCTVKGLPQREVWQTLYQQHYYRYCRRPNTLPKESKLQAFVRLGLIESLYER